MQAFPADARPAAPVLAWPCRQVAILYALHAGFFAGVSPSSVPLRQSILVHSLRRNYPGVLRDIAATQHLSDEAKAALRQAVEETSAAFLPT